MSIDPHTFRETLGHYPTGVALVTAIVDGAPVGMVVGSFTSVSLDPPLVAYLPMTSSYTYGLLKDAESFCINVLAADQLEDCRRFASRQADKFDGIGWHPAPSGAPILDEAVSWIDCTAEAIYPGGDHDIVVGRVRDLGVVRPVLPLLFFQGGYGHFAPLSLVAASAPEVLRGARMSELTRAGVEKVAKDEKVDIAILAKSGSFATFVATANESSQPGRTSVGMRLPLVPPLGSVFVADDESEVEGWIDKIPKVSDETRAQCRDLAARVREQGYSVSLRSAGSGPDEAVWAASRKLAQESLTPSEERELMAHLAATIAEYEPELEDDQLYDVRGIRVLIPNTDDVPLALRLSAPPGAVPGSTVKRWADRLKQLAREMGDQLSKETLA